MFYHKLPEFGSCSIHLNLFSFKVLLCMMNDRDMFIVPMYALIVTLKCLLICFNYNFIIKGTWHWFCSCFAYLAQCSHLYKHSLYQKFTSKVYFNKSERLLPQDTVDYRQGRQPPEVRSLQSLLLTTISSICGVTNSLCRNQWLSAVPQILSATSSHSACYMQRCTFLPPDLLLVLFPGLSWSYFLLCKKCPVVSLLCCETKIILIIIEC